MKEKDFACAKIVYDALCIKSDHLDQNGVIRPFKYIVAIDDDVTSAIWAVKNAREIHRIYGFYPTILCVGGKGMLSRHLYNESEAEVLANTCSSLGYIGDLLWVQGLDTGKNAVENIRNIAMMVDVNYFNRPNVLFCVTKRQSLIYSQIQRKQVPHLNAYWFVIEETLEEACKMMNAKSLCGGEMMLHELAGILPRCEREAGITQAPMFVVSPEVRAAADYLADRYRLKLPNKNLRSYLQYAKLYLSVLWHNDQIYDAIEDAIYDELSE